MRTTVDLPDNLMFWASQIFPNKTKKWILTKSMTDMMGEHAREGLLAMEGKFPHLKGKFNIDKIRGRDKMRRIQKMLKRAS